MAEDVDETSDFQSVVDVQGKSVVNSSSNKDYSSISESKEAKIEDFECAGSVEETAAKHLFPSSFGIHDIASGRSHICGYVAVQVEQPVGSTVKRQIGDM